MIWVLCLFVSIQAFFCASVCARACVWEWESEWESRQCELGVDLDWCRANRTIMDTWSRALLSICIWVFCNLPLQRKDATAPPAIYQSMKPIVYYHLVPLPVVQTVAMSERRTNFCPLFRFYVSGLFFFSFLAIGFHLKTWKAQFRITSQVKCIYSVTLNVLFKHRGN